MHVQFLFGAFVILGYVLMKVFMGGRGRWSKERSYSKGVCGK